MARQAACLVDGGGIRVAASRCDGLGGADGRRWGQHQAHQCVGCTGGRPGMV